MKVTEIIVSAGRTFNHPHEQYSNLKPQVTLKATLDDGDDAGAATKLLQAQAEGLVEDHKNGLLKSIEDLYQMAEARSRLVGLARQLREAQRETDGLRQKWPELAQLQLDSGEPAQPPSGGAKLGDMLSYISDKSGNDSPD
jgi:hypothetical protein